MLCMLSDNDVQETENDEKYILQPQAEGSIFKPEVTVFSYTDRP